MSKKTTIIKNAQLNGEVNQSKIDVIKDLLFGENIQEYHSEFESVHNALLHKKKKLEELIENVRTELNTLVDGLSTDLNIRITELDDKLASSIERLENEKVDRDALGNLFISLGEKLSKS